MTNTTKRPEPEIMKDILNVYIGLSPENLHCDGEISNSEAERKYRRLCRELNVLQKELGRNVDENEAYEHVDLLHA